MDRVPSGTIVDQGGTSWTLPEAYLFRCFVMLFVYRIRQWCSHS